MRTLTAYHVDGNAIIGALSLALGTPMDDATMTCAACGTRHPVAEAHVYLRCPGTVVRCPQCGAAEIVLVERARRFEVTMRNVATLELRAPAPPTPTPARTPEP